MELQKQEIRARSKSARLESELKEAQGRVARLEAEVERLEAAAAAAAATDCTVFASTASLPGEPGHGQAKGRRSANPFLAEEEEDEEEGEGEGQGAEVEAMRAEVERLRGEAEDARGRAEAAEGALQEAEEEAEGLRRELEVRGAGTPRGLERVWMPSERYAKLGGKCLSKCTYMVLQLHHA